MTADAASDAPLIVKIKWESFTLYLLCDHERSNSSVPSQLLVIGCIVVLRCADKDQCAKWAKLPFWSHVLRFASLRGLIIGLKDEDMLKTWASEVDPALREPSGRQLWYHRLVAFKKRSNWGGQWVARDPLSLDPTGMYIPYSIVDISSCAPLISTL